MEYRVFVFIALVTLAWSLPSQADVIVSPDSVIGNQLGEWNATHKIDFAIDQSGLSSSFASGATDFDTYMDGAPTHLSADSTFFVSQGGSPTGNIDLDLGSTFTIQQFALWQATSWPEEEVKSFTLLTSHESGFDTVTDVGSFAATKQLGENAPAEVFALTPSTGRFVRLQINSNWGGGGFTDVGELAFDVSHVGEVPEPSTPTILSLLGLSGLAFHFCRRIR